MVTKGGGSSLKRLVKFQKEGKKDFEGMRRPRPHEKGHWWRCSLSFSWSPRIEGAMGEVEAWPPEAVLGSLIRAHERLLVKVQASWSRRHRCFGDASTTNNHQGQQQVWSGAGLNLWDRLCVLWQAVWRLEDCRPWVLCCWTLVLLWFHCSLFFLLGKRKYLNFLKNRNPQLWDLGYVRKALGF